MSVIVCAYTLDRWSELLAALESVQRQSLAPRDIILVVDGNEELAARVRAHVTGVTVVQNRYGGGLSGGRRTGAELARGSILAFLDDDAVADAEWLAELRRAYDDPRALGAGGLVEPIWQVPAPRWLPAEYYWVVGCTYAGMPVQDGRIRNPIGANMSVRREVLLATGSFAPELGRSQQGRRLSGTAEETEFCIRASRLHPGGYWAYRPAAQVGHVVSAERTTWRYFMRRCRLEGTAKGILAGLAGPDAGLVNERAYVRSVLPAALRRELAAAGAGDRDAPARAGTIIAGVVITAASYLRTRLRRRRRSRLPQGRIWRAGLW